MTEAEWLNSKNPIRLLEDYLRGRATERKLRLLACGSCYQIWSSLTDDRSRKAVMIAERYADGLADEQTRQEACSGARNVLSPQVGKGIELNQFYLLHAAAYIAHEDACEAARIALEGASIGMGNDDGFRTQVQLPMLRDIFGNPFRPVTLDPSWRTEAVLALAEGIYQDRAFDRTPVLADALEDAGCSHEDILSHCRGEGIHVRGCWVVDLITGRK